MLAMQPVPVTAPAAVHEMQVWNKTVRNYTFDISGESECVKTSAQMNAIEAQGFSFASGKVDQVWLGEDGIVFFHATFVKQQRPVKRGVLVIGNWMAETAGESDYLDYARRDVETLKTQGFRVIKHWMEGATYSRRGSPQNFGGLQVVMRSKSK